MQIPLGRFSDSRDRRAVLAMTGGLAGVCGMLIFGVVTVVPEATGLLCFVGFLYGGFAFSVYPIAVAHLVDHLDANQVLDGCSMFLLVHGIGAVMGPVITGLWMDLAGLQMLPVYFVLMQCALAIAVVLLLRRVPTLKAPADQTGHYVPMVRTSPAVMELHPDQAANPPHQS